MDFADRIRSIADRIPKQTPHLETEAATSAALVLPFIQALGYDVFDPTEVVPEFTADVGIKKGEKVDYALLRDGAPIVLFEVKHWRAGLDLNQAGQLYRYFSVTKCRFAALTNGIVYRFYTDLEQPNTMDEHPFLELNMLDLRDAKIDALRQFHKTRFDVDALVSSASELKYVQGIRSAIAEELADPSDDLVKHFARKVYAGNLTKNTREQFRDFVRRAFVLHMTERLHKQLQSAIDRTDEVEPPVPADAPVELPPGVVAVDGDIVTTEDEVQGFQIVRAILAQLIDPDRVVMRDTKTYCGVLLDDNNRKPLCRLRFNAKQYYLGVFDAEKNESKIAIGKVADIYQHATAIRETVSRYEA